MVRLVVRPEFIYPKPAQTIGFQDSAVRGGYVGPTQQNTPARETSIEVLKAVVVPQPLFLRERYVRTARVVGI